MFHLKLAWRFRLAGTDGSVIQPSRDRYRRAVGRFRVLPWTTRSDEKRDLRENRLDHANIATGTLAAQWKSMRFRAAGDLTEERKCPPTAQALKDGVLRPCRDRRE